MRRSLSIILFTFLLVLPTVAQEDRKILVVASEHGLKPDTGDDVGPLLRNLIATLVASGQPSVLQLNKGIYRLGSGPSYNAAIVIENGKDISICGEGPETEIVLTDPRQGGFFVIQGERVTVENLSIDHDPLPFTQGTVLQVNAASGWFDYAIHSGYPMMEEAWFADAPKPYGQWGMVYDSKENRLKSGAADFVFMEKWEKVSRRVWRMYPVQDQRERLNDMSMGDRFVHLARHGHGGAVFFWKSKECQVDGVHVYASQSLAFGSVASERTYLTAVVVEKKPGTGRLLSTNSDGVHCQQDLRGPMIEDCRFEGMADDGINIYSAPNAVYAMVSENTIKTRRGGIIEEGDLLQVFEPLSGRIILQSRAVDVKAEEDGGYRIGLEAGISNERPAQVNWQVYNLTRCGADYVIRNTVFRNHRRHGLVLKASKGLVENVLVESVGGLGMVIGNDPDWPEGAVPSNITFSGVTVRDVGFSRWYGNSENGAVVQIMTKAKEGRLGETRGVDNISLRGITIENPPGLAIYLGAVTQVSLSDAKISYSQDRSLPMNCSAIKLANTGHITMNRVAIDAPGIPLESGVLIMESVDPGLAGVTVNELSFTGLMGTKATLDMR